MACKYDSRTGHNHKKNSFCLTLKSRRNPTSALINNKSLSHQILIEFMMLDYLYNQYCRIVQARFDQGYDAGRFINACNIRLFRSEIFDENDVINTGFAKELRLASWHFKANQSNDFRTRKFITLRKEA